MTLSSTGRAGWTNLLTSHIVVHLVVVAVPLEFAPPKYAVVVNAIQQRIQDGTYPPGVAIPSEAQLMAEFGSSRPTVVRALSYLQQAGWVEAQQGRGRFVRSRPAVAARQAPEHAAELLERDETAGVKLLKVGPMMAPPRAATALNLAAGTPVIARQRLVVVDQVGPIELGWSYIPVELAAGTDVGESAPLAEGLLRHLTHRKGIQFDHAVERLSGRLPTADEAELLEIGRRDVLITLLVTAFDLAGVPRVAVDVVVPAARHELEDAFPII